MSARFVAADSQGVAYIILDRVDEKVNAIDLAFMSSLEDAIEQARKAAPRGLVIKSAKADQFVGGADLNLITQTKEAAALSGAATRFQQMLSSVAALSSTTVAAINGNALGGGCELALACDWRVMTDSKSARIGLPEVQLGLLPAAGGTQRLPRLIGIVRALDLILNAKRLDPKRALRSGLVDEVVAHEVLDRAAASYAATRPKRVTSGGNSFKDRALTNFPPLRAYVLATAKKKVLATTRHHYPAPLAALEAVAVGLSKGIAAGHAQESSSFGKLASSSVGKSLLHLFLGTMGAARSTVGPPRYTGVLGAGFMGGGIAQALAVGGAQVRVRDMDTTRVAKGLQSIRDLTAKAVEKRALDRREGVKVDNRVTATTTLSGFGRSDLVIEAVFEQLDVKRTSLTELASVVSKDCVIASNTSAIPITDIAQGIAHPERVLGMHFFSPVHKMPLVEIIRTPLTNDAAVALALATTRLMGKTPIVVNDAPGFYTTRVIGLMMAEALRLLEKGAPPEDIDGVMVDFGWPVGPFTLMDEVGLEVGLHAGQTVAAAQGSALPRTLEAMVASGMAGKRNGQGFYTYEKVKRPNTAVHQWAKPVHPYAAGGIALHLTSVFTNEAVRCLDEGVLNSAIDGDLGAVLGVGFPPFLGGPFLWADAQGDDLCRRLRILSESDSSFKLAPSLAARRRFYP